MLPIRTQSFTLRYPDRAFLLGRRLLNSPSNLPASNSRPSRRRVSKFEFGRLLFDRTQRPFVQEFVLLMILREQMQRGKHQLLGLERVLESLLYVVDLAFETNSYLPMLLTAILMVRL